MDRKGEREGRRKEETGRGGRRGKRGGDGGREEEKLSAHYNYTPDISTPLRIHSRH